MVKSKKYYLGVLKTEALRLKILRDLNKEISDEEQSLTKKIKEIMLKKLKQREVPAGLVYLTCVQIPTDIVNPRKVYNENRISEKVFLSLVYIKKEDFERICKRYKLNPKNYYGKGDGYYRLDLDLVPQPKKVEEELIKLYKAMGIPLPYKPKKGSKK